MDRALVLFSGGVDSSTALAMAVKKYGSENVVALSVSYGQKHKREIESSVKIADYYKVEHLFLDLKKIFEYSDCALLEASGKEIPKETYGRQLKETAGSPVSTYVPFRNGLFLSSAASIALSKDCNIIIYGPHMDDAAKNVYPDCTKDFNDAINSAIYLGSGKKLRVEAPFISMTKADIVKIGLELNVPYEFSWSCYEGKDVPCGKCGTCLDRKKAFDANGVTDPLMVKIAGEYKA